MASMTSTRARSIAALVAVVSTLLFSTQSSRAQSAKSDRATVTGSWTLNVDDSPHGRMTMGLTLKQEGTKVTGTFASPHGDIPVEGTFENGTLSLATNGGELSVTFNAKLNDDGTLAGYLSSTMGDMKWTGERVKSAA
jgi:hypothetical protein